MKSLLIWTFFFSFISSASDSFQYFLSPNDIECSKNIKHGVYIEIPDKCVDSNFFGYNPKSNKDIEFSLEGHNIECKLVAGKKIKNAKTVKAKIPLDAPIVMRYRVGSDLEEAKPKQLKDHPISNPFDVKYEFDANGIVLDRKHIPNSLSFRTTLAIDHDSVNGYDYLMTKKTQYELVYNTAEKSSISCINDSSPGLGVNSSGIEQPQKGRDNTHQPKSEANAM